MWPHHKIKTLLAAAGIVITLVGIDEMAAATIETYKVDDTLYYSLQNCQKYGEKQKVGQKLGKRSLLADDATGVTAEVEVVFRGDGVNEAVMVIADAFASNEAALTAQLATLTGSSVDMISLVQTTANQKDVVNILTSAATAVTTPTTACAAVVSGAAVGLASFLQSWQ